MTLRARLPAALTLACALFLLTWPPATQAQSPVVSQHSLPWYVHEDLVTGERPLSFWETLLTEASAEATIILEGASGPVDTPCCTRLGAITVETFSNVDPLRDLYQISDAAEWGDLLTLGGTGQRAFLVDDVSFCGAPSSGIGCGTTTSCSTFPGGAGSDRIMVVSLEAWEEQDRLAATIAHENGHNSCLSHSDEEVDADPDSCNLMLSSSGGACLTAEQCDRFIAAANGSSSATCDCHTAPTTLAADAAACTTDEGASGLCSGGICGETGSDASATLYASVGTAADLGDATDEWMSLSALTGHWTASTPFGAGIEPNGLAYAEGRNLLYAVAPSGTNLNDLFSINAATGSVTAVGTMAGFEEMVALAFDPGDSPSSDDDRLLALARSSGVTSSSGAIVECRKLVAIDPDDASTTFLGPVNPTCSATSPGLTGLAYDSTRQKLYAAAYFSSKLWEIDLECSASCAATPIDDCVVRDSCPDDFYGGSALPGLAYSESNDRLYLIGYQIGPRRQLDSFDAETLIKMETLNIDGFSLGGLAAAPNPLPSDADSDGIIDSLDNCPSTANSDQADTDGNSTGDVCNDGEDGDGDEWADGLDNCPLATNADQADLDADGLGDVCDACASDAANDGDSDGVCGDIDNCPVATNADQADLDADGLGDACDACASDAANDGDSDGVCGDIDNCPVATNADQADVDADGLGDACDACASDAANDGDSDGVCGDIDNCPVATNADQADLDADGLGDACDTCASDAANDGDSDGVCGDIDNCPVATNADQADLDADGLGDACDTCASDAANDGDSDGVCGDIDNCPVATNADQADLDADGLGDACDTCASDAANDGDSDGVCGDIDNCPVATNADQADLDADGLGDACDTCASDAANDGDSDGVCGDIDNCPVATNADQADLDADGLGDVCDACASDAANDGDSDGVCGDIDNCPVATNADQADLDADGLGDACDACASDAANDGDSDGVCGDIDNCPVATNADQADLDADGLGDACDTCASDAANDGDSDGVCGDIDNCPVATNADQADLDADGLGDACDACASDAANDGDSDGVCGDIDNCPVTTNADQADLDADGLGDACDACASDAANDGDSDGVCGDIDNCPVATNADQADLDADGLGDACDACASDAANDGDSDGVCGDIDNCPVTTNADQADLDADGLGDACDACASDAANDGDSDGVCGDIDNCPVTTNADQADLDADGLGDACDADDDGDGFSDADELAAGTDPRDPTIFPAPEPSAHLLGVVMVLGILALRRRFGTVPLHG